MKRVRQIVIFALCASMTLSATSFAASVVTKDGREMKGTDVKFTGRNYVIATESGAKMTVPVSDVLKVYVKKPSQLDGLISKVKSGSHSSAIAGLEAIAKAYEKLNWDLVAYQWLVTAYMGSGQTDKAIETYNTVKRKVPHKRMLTVGLRRQYWAALEKQGQDSALRGDLTDAIRNGNREVAAEAQLRRADNLKKAGKVDEALRDGYLRTIFLFKDVEEVQPWALLKAAECFNEMGQPEKAKEFLITLRTDYGDSPEAQNAPMPAGGGS